MLQLAGSLAGFRVRVQRIEGLLECIGFTVQGPRFIEFRADRGSAW